MTEIVAEVLRGGRVESRHRGVVAVVRPDGSPVTALGNAGLKTYMRSAAKPFQAMPLLESGAADAFGFTNKELAVIMASHNAEAFHLEAVREVMRKAGLSVADLRCGFHRPMHKESAEAHLKEGRERSPLFNNCSGKHAGMLAVARFNNWPLDSYLDFDHPLQQEILRKLASCAGLRADEIERGIDGCSAPVFFLPVKNMALAFARFASGEDTLASRAFAVMSEHPEMIAGSGRFDTDFMREMNGTAISKVGAEGVRCAAVRAPEPVGIALKIEDGSSRVSAAVLLEVLAGLGLISKNALQQLSEYHRPVLKNCAGLLVGEMGAVVDVK